ncbi:MAG TPA: serine--tRNA ligase [Halobacteriales archaeon]|uniref:serine--tRNA ligase n=1 Tax=Candidatus Hikarchaeum yamanae TaxID=2675326 RepID=UPI0017A5AE0B|nr:serine--tRNA ligase [Halobacteriales archaeon]|tara:strand:- start:8386 stop:9741 length:1356 start_codon:yes stop_codon:yes gene_type:complete
MLARQYLRENSEIVKEAIKNRNMGEGEVVVKLLQIDEKWRVMKAQCDDLRHERNKVSTLIGNLKSKGENEAAEKAIAQSSGLKVELEKLEENAKALEEELKKGLLELPNVPHESVPTGMDESDNVEIRRVGFENLREFPEDIVPHYDLGVRLDIIDEMRGAKTTGSGFYFLKGEGARLEHALISLMLDIHREQGYIELIPPIPVSSASMTGTGQFPKFVNDAYKIEGEDLWLCPTAEVPVTNMYSEEILLDEDLPIKHQAYTPNFRREAGEHGTETRGIVRVHQFNKVELVNFTRPDSSYEQLELLVNDAEEVLKKLQLPYRVISLCTGDLTFSSAKTYDIEIWTPIGNNEEKNDGRWLEVSSASNFEDFQARRAGLRYRPKRHESADYIHTLNASGLALPRVMVAILEYYQNADGTVEIPQVLRPYMGGLERIEGSDPIGESAVGAGLRN